MKTLKRKKMCKSCIYREKVAIDNRHRIPPHNCHELEETMGCAGSTTKGEIVDMKTPQHLEDQWTSMMEGSCWKEIVGTTVKNRDFRIGFTMNVGIGMEGL